MSIQPPEIISKLISRGEGVPTSCGHCRQPDATLRCSRCKCVKYCQKICQKAHFKLHKNSCRAIAAQRVLADRVSVDNDGGSVYPVGDMIAMGDLLVATGYKESDTVLHGQLYYKEALQYYIKPMTKYNSGYHRACSELEDQVLLLIVAAGGDDKAIRSWCSEESNITGNNPDYRSNYYDHLTEEQKSSEEIMTLGVKYRGLAMDDTLFQIIYLFNQMKALSEYRRVKALKEGMSRPGSGPINNVSGVSLMSRHGTVPINDVSDILSFYESSFKEDRELAVEEEAIVKEIQSTIRAIQYFDKESYLTHLRDSLPLSEHHAPGLFREKLQLREHFQLMDQSLGRRYLWMILQDLFFETPGVNSILNEFVHW